MGNRTPQGVGMTLATSPYLNQPLRTLVEALAAREAKKEQACSPT